MSKNIHNILAIVKSCGEINDVICGWNEKRVAKLVNSYYYYILVW